MKSPIHSKAPPPPASTKNAKGVATNEDEVTAKNVRAIAELDSQAHKAVAFSDLIAGYVSRFCGSMGFVWLHVIFFTGWIVANTTFSSEPIDPYPFNFLTLVVSLEAIFLSTFIMISENRQQRLDERRNHLDLQINLLSEQENTKMLELLAKIASKLGIDENDPSLEALKEETVPENLITQIDESAKEIEKLNPA